MTAACTTLDVNIRVVMRATSSSTEDNRPFSNGSPYKRRIYTMSKYTTNVTTYKIYKPLISMIYFFSVYSVYIIMVIIEINFIKYCSPNLSEYLEKCILIL